MSRAKSLMAVPVFLVFISVAAGSALCGSLVISGGFDHSENSGSAVGIVGTGFSLIGNSDDTVPYMGNLDFFFTASNHATGSIGNLSGIAVGAIKPGPSVNPPPAFDPSTWQLDSAGNYYTVYDAGVVQFSGGFAIYSPATFGLADQQELFAVALTGTADMRPLIYQNGSIPDAGFRIISGTATVTYPASPAPESGAALLFALGAVAVYLSWITKTSGRQTPEVGQP